MNETIKFSNDFLIALSNWQRGWSENQERRRQIADELIKQCEDIPHKFKTVDGCCYRKRFIIEGEIIPILIDDDFFEGIASWTKDKNCAKNFKGIIKPNTKFVTLFKHTPNPNEIVINIISLWEDEDFKKAAEELKNENFEAAKPLFNFRDYQSEIILKSTLKGSEIEDMVGISSSFEDLCNMANIPEEKREELSIKYAKDPNGLPIEIPTFAGTRPTKEAITKTLIKFKETLETAKTNNIFVDWSKVAEPHQDDLKHKP
jgi:hypothetical protein